jgi:hypothetical protein
MSIRDIGLGRLLKFLASDEKSTISLLRGELRSERRKELEASSGGGDFYVPFWADAKAHVSQGLDLEVLTRLRIAELKQRKVLYTLLTERFLEWFDDVKRGSNSLIGLADAEAHTRHAVPGFDLVIRVENNLVLDVGFGHLRIVAPYFAKSPRLTPTWARVGLWLMSEALADFDITEMEILDVLAGRSYEGRSLALKGDEQAIFEARYTELLAIWLELRPYYNLD